MIVCFLPSKTSPQCASSCRLIALTRADNTIKRLGDTLQGFVEASNVNPVSEITALITAQRAYEMNSRVVKTADEMLATTSQLR